MFDETSVGKACSGWAIRSTICVLATLFALSPACAQERVVSQVARFDGATRLSVDPLGNAYVIDRTRGRLIRLNLRTNVQTVLGGAESPIRDPVAVDAGTGLSILVADGNTGRIGRFNRDLVWSGDFAHRQDTRARNTGTDDAIMDRSVQVHPTSITTLRTGRVSLLDSQAGTLHILNRRGDLERVVRLADLETEFAEPIDLCADHRDHIHILMSRPASVVSLDEMGTVLETRRVAGEPTGTIACTVEDVLVPTLDGLVLLHADVLEAWPAGLDGRVTAVHSWEDFRLYLTDMALYVERIAAPAPVRP